MAPVQIARGMDLQGTPMNARSPPGRTPRRGVRARRARRGRRGACPGRRCPAITTWVGDLSVVGVSGRAQRPYDPPRRKRGRRHRRRGAAPSPAGAARGGRRAHRPLRDLQADHAGHRGDVRARRRRPGVHARRPARVRSSSAAATTASRAWRTRRCGRTGWRATTRSWALGGAASLEGRAGADMSSRGGPLLDTILALRAGGRDPAAAVTATTSSCGGDGDGDGRDDENEARRYDALDGGPGHDTVHVLLSGRLGVTVDLADRGPDGAAGDSDAPVRSRTSPVALGLRPARRRRRPEPAARRLKKNHANRHPPRAPGGRRPPEPPGHSSRRGVERAFGGAGARTTCGRTSAACSWAATGRGRPAWLRSRLHRPVRSAAATRCDRGSC